MNAHVHVALSQMAHLWLSMKSFQCAIRVQNH